MKHYFIKRGLFLAALAVGLLSGCEKEKVVTLGMSVEGVGGSGNAATKVVINSYTPKWEEGDSVMLNDATMRVHLNGDNAQLMDVTPADSYWAVYPASFVGNVGAGSVSMTLPATQKYEVNSSSVQRVKIPMGAWLNAAAGELRFKNLCSLVKVTVTTSAAPVEISSIKLTSSAAPLCGTGSAAITDANPTLVITDVPAEANRSVTLSMPDGVIVAGAKAFYIVVPPFTDPSNLTIQVTTADHMGTYDRTGPTGATLARNTMATASVAILEEFQAGTPSGYQPKGGCFQLSDRKIRFAAGNLNYNRETRAFAFNANQYDYDKTHDGSSRIWEYFGWSGDGKNHYGISVSTSNGDYNGNALKDWGKILYSGSPWYTLSSEQWLAVMKTRNGVVIPKPAGGDTLAHYAEVKVNGKAGILLFPNYQADGTTTFVWPLAAGKAPAVIDTYNSSWNGANCNYTLDEWETLEDAGCVFLPAAGYRNGTTVNSAGSIGCYWSSTPNGTTNAYSLYFYGTSVNPQNNYNRYYGFSVRLVQDIN